MEPNIIHSKTMHKTLLDDDFVFPQYADSTIKYNLDLLLWGVPIVFPTDGTLVNMIFYMNSRTLGDSHIRKIEALIRPGKNAIGMLAVFHTNPDVKFRLEKTINWRRFGHTLHEFPDLYDLLIEIEEGHHLELPSADDLDIFLSVSCKRHRSLEFEIGDVCYEISRNQRRLILALVSMIHSKVLPKDLIRCLHSYLFVRHDFVFYPA